MSFSIKEFQYGIDTDRSSSHYSGTDGSRTQSFDLTWAFGTGRVGQSYLFKNGGGIYEARVTYFQKPGGLGFTPFRALDSPKDLNEAMYRQVPESEVLRCFACHTTASSIGSKFDEQHLIPGVTCEACHGPGAKHVSSMQALAAGDPNAGKTVIFNSGHLDPTEAVEFCGACHGSLWDIKLAGIKGPSTARAAPYRLVTSKCWGKGDSRLVCTSCHDPHEPLQTDEAAYDNACLRCHQNASGLQPGASHPGPACPVASKKCTTCHMPKVYVPEMHDTFTDHRIRIAKAREPYPE